MTTVLVVDDEPQIRRALATNLQAREFDVVLADTGRAALQLAADRHPDLVLLDIGLPDLSGIEVVHGLRGWTEVPIIMLTVRSEEADKVEALDAGADDFVTKPFGMNELLARMRAALRRTASVGETVPVVVVGRHGHHELRKRVAKPDLADKRVERSGEAVHLTPTEWELVEHLARHSDRLVTQRQLLTAVWGPNFDDESGYLRVHMANLRRKLEGDPSHPRYFKTEPGMGYRFLTDGDEER